MSNVASRAVVSGVSRWRKYAMQFADADYERIRDRRRFALSSRWATGKTRFEGSKACRKSC